MKRIYVWIEKSIGWNWPFGLGRCTLWWRQTKNRFRTAYVREALEMEIAKAVRGSKLDLDQVDGVRYRLAISSNEITDEEALRLESEFHVQKGAFFGEVVRQCASLRATALGL